MTKKRNAETDEFGVERYREGYNDAIGAVSNNLNEIADHLDDYDPHAAKALRWMAQLVSTYQPGE